MEPERKVNLGTGIWDAQVLDEEIFCACDDGSVRVVDLVSMKEVGKLQSLDKIRCTSLCVSTIEKGAIYAAYENGTIRRWKQTGKGFKSMLKMNGFSDSSTIWKIKEFDSKYLIAGDSEGRLTIWNRKSGSIVKTISELKADILDIVISKEYQTVYATGIDSRVVCARLNSNSKGQ